MIIDMSAELKLSSEIAAISMVYTNLFFLQKSYLEHERELVCCAAMFVASKANY